jgi:glucosylceramidase
MGLRLAALAATAVLVCGCGSNDTQGAANPGPGTGAGGTTDVTGGTGGGSTGASGQTQGSAGATGGGAGEADDAAVGAGGSGAGEAGSPAGFAADVWYSSENAPYDLATDPTVSPWRAGPLPLTYKLDKQKSLPITVPGGTATTKINVDPTVSYQTMLGFGNSMEESSVSNILKLSAAKRTELLTSIVDPVNGTGQNLFRVTIGTADFTGRPWYTYDDLAPGQTDPNMDKFSIQKDIDFGIIDVLKQMLAINPKIMFFGSPWSPPAWMKDSGTITGGNLVTANIPALAKYFRKFVEAYKVQGIPIYAVTLQNEPQHSQNSYPTCIVSSAQEAQLAQAVKQEMMAGGLDTKVWIFDHNFDIGVAYAQGVLGSAPAAAVTDGIAFHDYGGEPTEMTRLHNLYPTKDIFFTEKTLWGVTGVDRAAQYIRNWSRSYVSWLTMLDQNGLPNNGPNSPKLRRFVKAVNYAGAEYWPTAEHYLFGLYSKFVASGAKRISSDYGTAATVTNVAFLNPDGIIAVVVANQSTQAQPFALLSEGNQIWASIPAKTAATYVWHSGLGKSNLPAAAPN